MHFKRSLMNKLNELLDDAINDVLIDTTDRFNIDDPDIFDFEDYEESDRNGKLENDGTSEVKKSTASQKLYHPDGDYKHSYRTANYPKTKNVYDLDEDIEEPQKIRKGNERVMLGDYHVPDSFKTNKNLKTEEDLRHYQKPYSKDTYRQTQYDKDIGDAKILNLDHLRQNQKIRQPENYQTCKTSDDTDQYQEPINNATKTPPGNYQPTQRHYEYVPKPPVYSKPERQYQSESKTEKTNDAFQGYQTTTKTESQTSKTPQTTEEQKEVVNSSAKFEVAVPRMVGRTEWGALPPMGHIERMQAPAEGIVFSLNTDTPECKTQKECQRAVKEIQARQMGEGLADIQYSFLVGGDGNMYEGRGWGLESGVPKEKSGGTNYNIAFIGRFQDDTNKIPPEMLGPVQDLVVYAKVNKYVLGDKMIKEMKKPKIQM